MSRCRIVLLFLFLLMPLTQAGFCVDEKKADWYKPQQKLWDHDNDPDFHFLIGNWSSIDPKICYKESWTISAEDSLTGLRTYFQPDPPLSECDVICFVKTSHGVVVCMQRTLAPNQALLRGTPVAFTGNWSVPSLHRGTIHFAGLQEKDKVEINSRYDSPAADLLDVELETIVNKVSKKQTFHLKRDR